TFERNRATGLPGGPSNLGDGGGIDSRGPGLWLEGLRMLENNAWNGGAIRTRGKAATMVNCLLARNTSDGSGGGIVQYLDEAGTELINCTLTSNVSQVGGGIYMHGTTFFRNCVVWSNQSRGTSADTLEKQQMEPLALRILQ